MRAVSVLLCSITCFALANATHAQVEVEYDHFMQAGLEERVALFHEITPENQASLAKTHTQRWLAANRERLSDDQIAAVEDFIAWVEPRLYDSRNRQDVQGESRVKAQHLREMLGAQDFIAASFSRDAPYIPPQDEDY